MNIYVGDYVKISLGRKAIIENLSPKKRNTTFSAIWTTLSLLLPVPKPDWLLVDKLIVSCYGKHPSTFVFIKRIDKREEIKHLTNHEECGLVRPQ